jgi:hypothetical protein
MKDKLMNIAIWCGILALIGFISILTFMIGIGLAIQLDSWYGMTGVVIVAILIIAGLVGLKFVRRK